MSNLGSIPIFHNPCGRRTVIVGRHGHQLGHPGDCPECQQPNQNSPLGQAIEKTRQRIEEAISGARQIPARLKKELKP